MWHEGRAKDLGSESRQHAHRDGKKVERAKEEKEEGGGVVN